MRSIEIDEEILFKGAKIIERNTEDGVVLEIPASGGGLALPMTIGCPERYMVFWAECLEDHSLPLLLILDLKKKKKGAYRGADIMFGIMPHFETLICLDFKWLDGHVLFPGSTEGQRKVIRHGGRVEPQDLNLISLETYPSFHNVKLKISGLCLTDERPKEFPIPDIKLIDEFGQYKKKDWPGKVKNLEDLKYKLNEAFNISETYGPEDWDDYGGWFKKELTPGTGYFNKIKAEGRWWLVDPLGYAFFSTGPVGVMLPNDCRVNDLEKLIDWLPPRDDPVYGSMYEEMEPPFFSTEVRHKFIFFSFGEANLYKAFGSDWPQKWLKIIVGHLKTNGMNTLSPFLDVRMKNTKTPYTIMLDRFPETKKFIFRDFPDVLSEEYAKDAEICACALEPYIGDLI
jgi:hypothetical protein